MLLAFIWSLACQKGDKSSEMTLTWNTPGPTTIDIRLLYNDVERLKKQVADLQITEGKNVNQTLPFKSPQP